MSELWILKSTTDVHRLIDNKLPPGSKCIGVTMIAHEDGVEEFTAIVNGQEVIVEAPPESSAEDVAAEIVKGAPEPVEPEPPWDEPTSENAAMEGAEVAEEYEYDDSDDDEDDEDEVMEFDAPPKPKKSKSKSKKK